MTKYKRIILVGHMGAGKSLLGKTLAEKLGWEHVDTNIGLERYIGLPLQEIIGKQGEEVFFKCQNNILEHYLAKDNLVITTEDSYILDEKNRERLSSEFVVYLKVTTPIQIERMSHGPKPLLLVSDLTSFLNKLHQERDSLYEAVATLTVDSQSVESDIKAIEKSL